jgi:hypothetical protein
MALVWVQGHSESGWRQWMQLPLRMPSHSPVGVQMQKVRGRVSGVLYPPIIDILRLARLKRLSPI